jgi:hypothetical protein
MAATAAWRAGEPRRGEPAVPFDLRAQQPCGTGRELRSLLALHPGLDELAHVGQRRNFLGPLGVHAARGLIGPMYRLFFRGLPETRLLFDFGQMIEDGKAFDYSAVPAEVIRHSWLPSYCRA